MPVVLERDEVGNFVLVEKANPYHGKDGKFTSISQAHSVTERNLKSKDKVIANIKKRLLPSELSRIEQFENNMKGKPTTADLYKRSDGSWTPERQALHASIMRDFFKDTKRYIAKEGEKPTLITLGGRGGSGKSKLTDGTLNEFDASKFKIMDPDKIKTKLPGYDGTNAALFHEESSYISDMIFEKALSKRLNFVQDVTIRSKKGVGNALVAASANGYELEGHYMHLPPEEAGVRAAKRGLKADDPRYVPLSIIAENTNNEANFRQLAKQYFKKWSIHSNEVKMGEKPKLLDRSS